MAVGSLRPHPLAAPIYGESSEGEDRLRESIQVQGVPAPLLVTPEGLVVSGCERLRAARQLGLAEVPVRRLDSSDADGLAQRLIESNVAREKTAEQKVREYRELKRIEAAWAADRRGARRDLLENLPAGEAGGTARDLAAARVGWSGRTAERAAQVLAAIEERAGADENMHDVEEVRATLNGRSVDAAHQKAAEFGWLADQPGRPKAPGAGSPERRAAGLFRQANTAVARVAGIFGGKEAAGFTPEQNRRLHEALLPVLRWVDSLSRV